MMVYLVTVSVSVCWKCRVITYIYNQKFENIVIMKAEDMFLGWVGGYNTPPPHIFWAIVSNILLATIYVIIIFLEFPLE